DKFVVAVPDHDLAYAVRVIALELCDQLSGSHGLFRIGSRTGALGLWMVMPERPGWLGSAKADRLPSASCYSRRGSPALAPARSCAPARRSTAPRPPGTVLRNGSGFARWVQPSRWS